MTGDYGGASDGQCEYSFFVRCDRPSEVVVQFGQFGGWRYAYCRPCANRQLEIHEDARVVETLPRQL